MWPSMGAHYLIPVGDDELTVGAEVVGLDQAEVAGCDFLFVRCEGGSIRRRFNQDPTPSVGMLMNDGDAAWFNKAQAAALRLIGSGESDALLRIEYYRKRIN